jgi:hypothetical protein
VEEAIISAAATNEKILLISKERYYLLSRPELQVLKKEASSDLLFNCYVVPDVPELHPNVFEVLGKKGEYLYHEDEGLIKTSMRRQTEDNFNRMIVTAKYKHKKVVVRSHDQILQIVF